MNTIAFLLAIVAAATAAPAFVERVNPLEGKKCVDDTSVSSVSEQLQDNTIRFFFTLAARLGKTMNCAPAYAWGGKDIHASYMYSLNVAIYQTTKPVYTLFHDHAHAQPIIIYLYFSFRKHWKSLASRPCLARN